MILAAGIDDWGGVSPLTPDHVNPERPWPQIGELADRTAAGGFTLRERLTIYPGYLREPWLDPRVAPHVAALADPETGLAREGAMPQGLTWQEPDGGWGEAAGRTDLHVTIDTAGRTADRRDDFAEVYGDWAEVGTRIVPAARRAPAGGAAPQRLRAEVQTALRHAESDPGGLSDDDALALLDADGPELEALAALADAVRRDTVGDDITYVVDPQHQLHQRVLHRLPVLRVRPAPHRRRRVHAVADPGRRPRRGGVAGRRDRGVHAGRHPP